MGLCRLKPLPRSGAQEYTKREEEKERGVKSVIREKQRRDRSRAGPLRDQDGS